MIKFHHILIGTKWVYSYQNGYIVLKKGKKETSL